MQRLHIITLHYIRNYGSVLQTYATQAKFETMGYEAEIVDYVRPNAEDGAMIEEGFEKKNLHGIKKMLYMLHVRKRNRQKYSEACRPILGKYTDGWAGRIIDLLAVFALLAGTATTFSVATPLMATIIGELFHVAISRTVINIIILLITCAVYTYSLCAEYPQGQQQAAGCLLAIDFEKQTTVLIL